MNLLLTNSESPAASANERPEQNASAAKDGTRKSSSVHGHGKQALKKPDVAWLKASSSLPKLDKEIAEKDKVAEEPVETEELVEREPKGVVPFLVLTDEIASRLAMLTQAKSSSGPEPRTELRLVSDNDWKSMRTEKPAKSSGPSDVLTLVADGEDQMDVQAAPPKKITDLFQINAQTLLETLPDSIDFNPQTMGEEMLALRKSLQQDVTGDFGTASERLLDEITNVVVGEGANENRVPGPRRDLRLLVSALPDTLGTDTSAPVKAVNADVLSGEEEMGSGLLGAQQLSQPGSNSSSLLSPIQQVIRDVTRELKSILPSGDGSQSEEPQLKSIRVSLSPEFLGGVEISLRMRGNSIEVQVVAERNDTAELLTNGQRELADSITSLGFESQTVNCIAKSDSSASQNAPDDQGGWRQDRSRNSDNPLTSNSNSNSSPGGEGRPRKDHEQDISGFFKNSKSGKTPGNVPRGGRGLFV